MYPFVTLKDGSATIYKLQFIRILPPPVTWSGKKVYYNYYDRIKHLSVPLEVITSSRAFCEKIKNFSDGKYCIQPHGTLLNSRKHHWLSVICEFVVEELPEGRGARGWVLRDGYNSPKFEFMWKLPPRTLL